MFAEITFLDTKSMSLNKVMLIGNVGRDPEVRYLDGNGANGAGTKVATFTLATSERYRDRSGEVRENTEWHNIVAWRQSADIAEKYVHKGTQLYIEGRLRTRSYTGQDGVKKYTTEITVDNLQLLGKREGGPDDSYAPHGGQSYGGGQQGGYQRQGYSQGGYQGGQSYGGGQQGGQAQGSFAGGQGFSGGQSFSGGQQGGYNASAASQNVPAGFAPQSAAPQSTPAPAEAPAAAPESDDLPF